MKNKAITNPVYALRQYYRLKKIDNGDIEIYLKEYNVRVATIHHNSPELVEILKDLFDIKEIK